MQMQVVKMKINPATEPICKVASPQGVQLSPDSGKLLQRQQQYLVWCHMAWKTEDNLSFTNPEYISL